MSPRRPWSERASRLIPAAGLVFAPKCALCLLAGAGLGATLGPGGPELCGATPAPAGPWWWLLPVGGIVLGLTALRRRA